MRDQLFVVSCRLERLERGRADQGRFLVKAFEERAPTQSWTSKSAKLSSRFVEAVMSRLILVTDHINVLENMKISLGENIDLRTPKV